ncbi:hypothetical protein [Flavobacterium chungangense]|uniref:hypothetical protein n=1 Tax=Flavobacterium chungangense TaxID=554283 RepID=UPI001F3A3045|nr:hypothetical protein [Flavobacterium chungangense]
MLILPLIVVSGLVFSFASFTNRSDANREIKNETSKKSIPNPLSAAERKTALKKWEATPDGIMYKKWEASPAGKKVYAGEAKIRKAVRNYTNMNGVVTSLSLPPGSRLGFGMMVRINGDDYILSFGPEKSDKSFLNFNNEFQQLHKLKVNDKIIIKSHAVSHAPKYSYPIVSGDYIELDGKIVYKRAPRKGGC